MGPGRTRWAGTLRKARALPAEDRRLLAEAALLMPAIALGLRLLPFKSVLRLLSAGERLTAGRRARPDASSARAGALVDAAARRLVPAPACLTRALALHWILRARGIEATLVLGAAGGSAGGFSAHAWVERSGAAVTPPGAVGQHVPLLRWVGGAPPAQRPE